MTRKRIKAMIQDLIGQIDYDLAKSLDPETAEEPEAAKKEMEELIDLVSKYVNA